jgi:thiamine-monophosphate kinase
MGGKPLGLLFAFGLPKETNWQRLEAIHTGISNCSSKYKVPVLGGDLKENEVLTIAGTAFGIVPKEQILWRTGARPGDAVALTGFLSKGLSWLRKKSPENASKLLRIEPRLREGQLLGKSGAVTSCIDTSDGLSASLHHLAKASQAGFQVDFDYLPFAKGLSDKEKETKKTELEEKAKQAGSSKDDKEKIKTEYEKKLNALQDQLNEIGKKFSEAQKSAEESTKKVKETKITGPSSKFSNQKVGLEHVLKDKDIVEFKTF